MTANIFANSISDVLKHRCSRPKALSLACTYSLSLFSLPSTRKLESGVTKDKKVSFTCEAPERFFSVKIVA